MANLGDDPQLIMLAAAIPTDAMRAQLYKTLQARWADGPEPLAAATGYPATAIGDPALILILKSLPRRMPPTPRRRGRAPSRRRNRWPNSAGCTPSTRTSWISAIASGWPPRTRRPTSPRPWPICPSRSTRRRRVPLLRHGLAAEGSEPAGRRARSIRSKSITSVLRRRADMPRWKASTGGRSSQRRSASCKTACGLRG